MTERRTGFALGALTECRRPELQDFAHAWVGIEPTFSNAKAIRKWRRKARRGDEDGWFESRWVLGRLRAIGRGLRDEYERRRARGDRACVFPAVDLDFDRDPWGVERVNLKFRSGRTDGPDFEVRFGLDPETFEYSIKPVPLSWFHDERFERFLSKVLWRVPREHGLVASMAHGGGQFSFSAKTYLQASLLADDIAYRLDHPELSTWICDYPNCDDRAFRATPSRAAAYEAVLDAYWSGAFHPDALGVLRVRNALLDRGFEPARTPARDSMDPARGPKGDARAVFQTNFAFGRAVRLRAQAIDPGYWQAQHPDEDGYRPDQIMRYGEGNLNRLQIAGELHVKSGKVLDVDEVPEFDAPLELGMLYDEASWEHRAQMSKTTARDFVEAVLLEAHHAEWLLGRPHHRVRSSLAQDAILRDAETTLSKRDPKLLARLRKTAREENLAASRGRIKSDAVEPEAMFWAAWHALETGERAEIAREAISGFVERVENAATKDPRRKWSDPMEPHRHRVHPILWQALRGDRAALDADTTLARESRRWHESAADHRERRPIWSPTGEMPPWK